MTLIEVFMQELDRLRRDELGSRTDSSAEAIRDYQASVHETQTSISVLQQTSGLLSMEHYQDQVYEADQLEAEVLKVEAELRQVVSEVTQLAQDLGVPPELAAAVLQLYSDHEFLALTEQMSEVAADLATASRQYGAAHPKVRQPKLAYEALQRDALSRVDAMPGLDQERFGRLGLFPDGNNGELLTELVQKESRRAGLDARLTRMREMLVSRRQELLSLAPTAAELQDMQRNFDVAEAIFASAIARAEASRTDLYASYPLAQVLEDPSLPETSSAPMTKLSIAAGIAATLALIIGLGMAWFRHLLLDPALRRYHHVDESG
ncbi:hypothetical protein [Palleronia caenipelagi]|uniref:Tyrosine kinase G-rich domain-containing protein n=1 Tax=Palleronia caenipelagi TaxID=2489174 RepID=A0A547PMF5_9RHOB|nr:hypothetical protein [Palleronia caenipelagi]TRD15332.1 hypothetical protein FEV53_16975 [Palleronia caenipelagi]